MRRALIALLAAVAPAAALADTLNVPMDHAVRVSLPAPAQDVIVGNPAIADVSVADPRHLIVTAKSQGVTNLIVATATGRTIFSQEIVVGKGETAGVVLISGSAVKTYSCTPQCREAQDDSSFVSQASAAGGASTPSGAGVASSVGAGASSAGAAASTPGAVGPTPGIP